MHRTEAVVKDLHRGCSFNASRQSNDLIAALIIEIGELREAIESGADWQIVDELADVLFNVLSLAAVLEDEHGVSLDAADRHAARKMTGRHPYVFGDAADPGPELAPLLWNERKKAEELERIDSCYAIVGSGSVQTTASDVSANLIAQTIANGLAPFEGSAGPEPTTYATADGRFTTVWTMPDGKTLAYTFISGPKTTSETLAASISAFVTIRHSTSMREVRHA
jgi:NTP pyrophosphatase (non-canonical NTP hydrolase)